MTPGDELRAFLERRTGFSIPSDRWEFLAPRFLARIGERGFDSESAYVDYLSQEGKGRTELEELYNALTVRKTSFFRNPACFKALEEKVLPQLLAARDTDRPLSIWSAGCATGEEVYSIAMVARSVLGDDVPLYVLGTDISPDALSRARQGSYPAKSADEVPARYQRYLTVVGGRTWVRQEIRDVVEFTTHNLASESPPRAARGRWDVISCRNVLIYFGPPQAREVLAGFAGSLAGGGALFLGHAEVFTDMADFKVEFYDQTFFYRREDLGGRALGRRETRAMRRPTPSKSQRTGDEPRVRRSQGAQLDAPTERWSARRRPGDTPTRAGTRDYGTESALGTVSDETRASTRIDGMPYDLLLQASTKRARGDLEAAVVHLRAAIERAPRWARSRVQLAEVYREQGHVEQAIRQLEAAVDVEPLDPRAHYLVGLIRAEGGAHGTAEVAFRRALYLEPDFVWARSALAGTLRATGRLQRARRELRNVIRTLRTVELSRLQAGNPADTSLADLARRCEADIEDLDRELS